MQSPYANLIGSRTVNDPAATNLMAILLAGSNAPLPVEHAFMPPFARGHSDDELAAVANFVNGFFGNGTEGVALALVMARTLGTDQTRLRYDRSIAASKNHQSRCGNDLIVEWQLCHAHTR
jgi:hypothetical protein